MGNRFSYHCFMLISMVFLLALFSCESNSKRSVGDLQSLLAFTNRPENGLVKSRTFAPVNWKVRVVPNESNGLEGVTVQDPSMSGLGTVHLLVNVSPGTIYGGGDVMTNGTHSLEEYQERMIQLNFRMSENFQLKVGSQNLTPKLCHMENTFGLSNDRNIHVVFADPLLDGDIRELPSLDFIIADWVFGTGISHYSFESSKLKNLPFLSI